MDYSLPTSVTIDGTEHPIRNRGDYRAVLDVIAALNDPDLSDKEKWLCALYIFYEDMATIADLEQAIKKMILFINMGEEEKESKKTPQLMDWEQDFRFIVAPINRILGTEIRVLPYLHWWSFISAYYEIGDCSFANFVAIRKKLKTGKKLDKWERDFYIENKDIIDLKQRLSTEEQNLINTIMNG